MKKLMKRKTFFVFSLIFLMLVVAAFVYFFKVKYQKSYENVPEISIVLDDGTEVKAAIYRYEWTYKGETDEFSENFTPTEYEFTDENTVYISTDRFGKTNAVWNMNVKYKTILYNQEFYEILDENSYSGATTGSGAEDYSTLLTNGTFSVTNINEVGEYVVTFYIRYLNQGYARYAIKIIAYEGETAKAAKDYLNTSIEDEETISELVSKIDFNKYLKSVSVEGTTLNLKYEYFIDKDSIEMNNLILFACIPELEEVVYTAENNNDTGIVTSEDGQIEEYVITQKESDIYTREDVEPETEANIENLIKYMESL